jgi:O-antigen/teichoic acid export membrane protein
MYNDVLAGTRPTRLAQRLLSAAAWTTIGSIASRVLILGATIVTARILGQETFGGFGVVQSTTMMFSVVAGFGMGITATKFVAELRTSDPRRAGQIVGLSLWTAAASGLTTAVVVYFLAPWLASRSLAAPWLTAAIRDSAVILFATALTGAQTGALAGLESFETIALLNIATAVLSWPAVIAGALYAGLPGAVRGLAIGSLVPAVMGQWLLHRQSNNHGVEIDYGGCWAARRVFATYSVPAVLAGLMTAPTTWLCNAILVRQHDGYSQMGLLTAATQWRTAVLYVPSLASSVMLPILATLVGEKDRARYSKVLRANVAFSAGSALLVAVPVVLFANSIMSRYGDGFSEGASILELLVISAVLAAALTGIGQVIATAGNMWLGFLFNVIWSLSIVVLSWLLRAQGAHGIAVATCGAYAIQFCVVTVYAAGVLKTVRVRP